MARRQCSKSVPRSGETRRQVVGLVLVRRRAAAPRGTARARRARRRRRSCARTRATDVRAATAGRRSSGVRMPAAGRLVPPVLHVALDELPAGGAQQVLARELGPREQQRHHVLQLVAEAEGAAGLVVAGARPEPAGERPGRAASGSSARRTSRRACAPGPRRACRPTIACTRSSAPAARRPTRAVPRDQLRARASRRVPWPSRNTSCARLAGRERDARPAARRRDRARRRSCPRASRARAPPGRDSEPLRPRNERAVAGRRARRLAGVRERDAAGELLVVGVPREHRAGRRHRSSVTTCRCCPRAAGPSTHSL